MEHCEREQEVQAMLDGHTAESDELRAHLAECAFCREHAEAIQSVRQMMTGVQQGEAPDFDEVWPGIRQGIAKAKSRSNTVAWLSAAAAACLIALSLLSLFAPGNSSASAKSYVDTVRTDIQGATTETVHEDDGTAIVWVNVPEGDMW